MKRRTHILIAATVTALLLLLFLLTPARLSGSVDVPILPADLDRYLDEAEGSTAYPLIPGTEKRIRWQQPGVATPYAIVYLHGFSASRRELSPTLELVADNIGANLFETRLAGHGRADGALVDTSAEEWLRDAAEALAIGERIGEQIILVGTSTGATLAAALLSHDGVRSVGTVVLISPNFALQDGTSRLLTGPAGPQLAELLVGPTRTFETRNDQHAMFWSSTYPTSALVEMMRLVDYANANVPASIDADLLLLLSPDDKIVSPAASRDLFDRIDAPRKELIEVRNSDDAMNHVLAGDILSPSTTAQVAASITDFILGE